MIESTSFSVLMSVYKNEKPEFLCEALDSILNNTIRPAEIVMVKDGPLPQELEDVLSSYQDKTRLFRFVIHEKNLGLGISLRDGLFECKYEIVARMDTDDRCHPMRFEKQLKYLMEHPNIAAVGSNVEEFSSDYLHPDQLVVYPESQEAILKFAKKRNPMRHPSMMFRKSSVMEIGNYRHFLWFEDYDLCVRLLAAGYQLENLQGVLLYCRADRDLFARRGGLAYIKQDILFQHFMFTLGFIRLDDFIFNCVVRTIVRLMPNCLRKWFYQTFLRKKY